MPALEAGKTPETQTGCRECLVEGLRLENGRRDGLYVGSGNEREYSEDITIRSVFSDGNERQGLSVTGVDGLLVEDCVFMNTRGQAPGAGIDLEPNELDKPMKDVVIRNCVFRNNTMALHICLTHLDSSSKPVSVRAEKNLVRNHHLTGWKVPIRGVYIKLFPPFPIQIKQPVIIH